MLLQRTMGGKNPDDSPCHELVFLCHALVAGMTFALLIVSPWHVIFILIRVQITSFFSPPKIINSLSQRLFSRMFYQLRFSPKRHNNTVIICPRPGWTQTSWYSFILLVWHSQIKQLFSLKVVLYSLLFSVIGILNNPQFIKHKISWLTFIKFGELF